jgi:hypothetical protein
LIEPLEGAGAAFAANHHINIEFLRVHAEIIDPSAQGEMVPLPCA